MRGIHTISGLKCANGILQMNSKFTLRHEMSVQIMYIIDFWNCSPQIIHPGIDFFNLYCVASLKKMIFNVFFKLFQYVTTLKLIFDVKLKHMRFRK